MPVLPVFRDPVLISIDRQRLNDLGIPAEPGHECLCTFYGAFGVITPVLIVPEGWQNALPDEPPEEEWDTEAWEFALHDSSQENPSHRRKIGRAVCFQAGVFAGGLFWIALDGLVLLQHIILTGGGRGSLDEEYLDQCVESGVLCLASGAIGGALAPWVGNQLSTPEGRWIFGLLLFLYFLIGGGF